MTGFFGRCKASICRAFDNSFVNNIANIVLLIVVALLVISLMVCPGILIALALFGLFLWAILYC